MRAARNRLQRVQRTQDNPRQTEHERPVQVLLIVVASAWCLGDAAVMRAVVKTGPGYGCEFVTDRDEPALAAGEVRLEIASASVCGSDAAFFEKGDAGGGLTMTYPRTMGHEVAGTVLEVGPQVEGVRVGSRVAVEPHLQCGDCFFCRNSMGHNCASIGILGVTVDGGFAERMVIQSRSCFALPDEIEFDIAALMEPAGCAVHAILRTRDDVRDQSVLVLGAGPIGLVAAQLVRSLGAREVLVVEPNEYRRTMAAQMGFTAIGSGIEPLEHARSTTRARRGFDLSLECSGHPDAYQSAVAAVRREATVVALGLVKKEVPLNVTDTLITRGLTLKGSWGRSIWDTWEQLVPLVVDGRIDLAALVTHRLPISSLPQALELMRGEAGKVILDPALPD